MRRRWGLYVIWLEMPQVAAIPTGLKYWRHKAAVEAADKRNKRLEKIDSPLRYRVARR